MRLVRAARLAILVAIGAVALAGAGGLPGFSWHRSSSTYRVYIGGGPTAVSGMSGASGQLRTKVVLPGSWPQMRSSTATRMKFGPLGSCRYTVTIRGRMVVTAQTAAVDRAATLMPAAGAYLRVNGTRDDAAYRVIRVKGTPTVRGLLIQPLPASSSPGVAAGQRLFAELVADGVADPKTECHSGGPRTIAEAIGDAFAAGSAGGFISR